MNHMRPENTNSSFTNHPFNRRNKKMKTTIKNLVLASAATLIAGASHAAVILDGSVNFTTAADSNTIVRQDTYTFSNASLGGLDATGSDKLVVVFGSENANGVGSVTYGGVSLTQALYLDGGHEIGIFFLDNPAVNGDLFINPTGGSVNGLGGTVFILSNTKDGFDAVGSSSSSTSTSLSADAGSFVVAGSAKNQGTAPAIAAPFTSVFSSGSGSSATGVGYLSATSTGTVTPTFSQTGTSVGAVEFEAVPEPGSLALLAAGGLLIASRRRRG